LVNKLDSNKARKKRHFRVRNKISGTSSRPRLSVFRSGKHIYAQLIDDAAGLTLLAASSLEKGFEKKGSVKEAARLVGNTLAQRAVQNGIKEVVFDRGGYIYHGRVKELAEGAREGGLSF
jgi:large subunit ribosomal protein L18